MPLLQEMAKRYMTKKELADEAVYLEQLIPVETSINHALLGPLTNVTEMKAVLPDLLHPVIDTVMNSRSWIRALSQIANTFRTLNFGITPKARKFPCINIDEVPKVSKIHL